MRIRYPIETINFYLQDHEPGSGISRGYFMERQRMRKILTYNASLIKDPHSLHKWTERINDFMDQFPTLEQLQDMVSITRLNRARS